MGRKIFVSYKYSDYDVKPLRGSNVSTVRDYVDIIEALLKADDHIYKGERDGEDLSQLSEQAIWSRLKDKIYDSSLTIVMISPRMRDSQKADRDQWIPWEIAYSLKETSRHDSSGRSVYSRTNAMMAVVLPDSGGSYGYYLENKSCCQSGCVSHHTGKLFNILRRNKFNYKFADRSTCSTGSNIWRGTASYIEAVKWDQFVNDPEACINAAYDRREDVGSYDIHKEV